MGTLILNGIKHFAWANKPFSMAPNTFWVVIFTNAAITAELIPVRRKNKASTTVSLLLKVLLVPSTTCSTLSTRISCKQSIVKPVTTSQLFFPHKEFKNFYVINGSSVKTSLEDEFFAPNNIKSFTSSKLKFIISNIENLQRNVTYWVNLNIVLGKFYRNL